MKTMTCKQLGGPCDFTLHGNTANEVIKAQDSHLREMVKAGDDTHKSALKSMKGRWKTPYQEWDGIGKPSVILLLSPKLDMRRMRENH
jgi:predicted small metal-binding protein